MAYSSSTYWLSALLSHTVMRSLPAETRTLPQAEEYAHPDDGTAPADGAASRPSSALPKRVNEHHEQIRSAEEFRTAAAVKGVVAGEGAPRMPSGVVFS